MKLSRLGLVAFLFVLLPTAARSVQNSRVVDEPVQAHPVGDEAIGMLKSPYCPGLMLEVCPSPQAKILRDSIQLLAQGGVPADSLVAWMLANHGEEYRAVPRVRGSGLFAWLIPPAALLIGLFSIVLALRHLRSRQTARPQVVEPLSKEDESVLADALQELKAAEEVPF